MTSNNSETKKAARVAAAFRRFFDDADGKVVLDALYGFCFGSVGGYIESPSLHAFEEGKRCAFMHIMKLANLDIGNLIKRDNFAVELEELEKFLPEENDYE